MSVNITADEITVPISMDDDQYGTCEGCDEPYIHYGHPHTVLDCLRVILKRLPR